MDCGPFDTVSLRRRQRPDLVQFAHELQPSSAYTQFLAQAFVPLTDPEPTAISQHIVKARKVTVKQGHLQKIEAIKIAGRKRLPIQRTQAYHNLLTSRFPNIHRAEGTKLTQQTSGDTNAQAKIAELATSRDSMAPENPVPPKQITLTRPQSLDQKRKAEADKATPPQTKHSIVQANSTAKVTQPKPEASPSDTPKVRSEAETAAARDKKRQKAQRKMLLASMLKKSTSSEKPNKNSQGGESSLSPFLQSLN